MATIYVTDREGKEHVLEVAIGLSVMESLREIDDGVEALCGGMCSCATCHVYIDPEWAPRLSERGDDELELLEDTECFKGQESRLSCQITVTAELDGMRLIVAPEE
jgi:2Fe-2S ferredoxin